MTKEQVNQYREYVQHPDTCGWFYSIADSQFYNPLTNCIRGVLSKEKTLNVILDIYCSPQMLLLLMDTFWSQDFNYLGTRIRIHPEQNLEQEPTKINPSAFFYRQIIVIMKQNKPVAFIEQAF